MEAGIGLIALILGGLAVGLFAGLGGGGEDTDTEEEVTEILGTTGQDDLVGTDGPDEILGFGSPGAGGGDTIDALGGDDVITGGPGQTQVLIGGPGDDTINVNPEDQLGDAHAYGGSGSDSLIGGPSRDWLFAAGFETIEEYNQADPFFEAIPSGDTEADVLDGGLGDDLLYFSGGDTATGGEGADEFHVLETDIILADENPARIMDYEADDLDIFFFDVDPDLVELFDVQADGDDAVIRIDGQPVVIVEGAGSFLSMDDVRFSSDSIGGSPVVV